MNDITILDALIISLIGMAIVFAVLAILMCVIMLMGLISDKGHLLTDKLPKFKNPFRKKKAAAAEGEDAQAAPAAPLAVGTCGELVLVRTEERDAAMIMAIVADSLDTPLNELRFKRIERLEDAEVEK